jgi:TetR/AcrR family transcriptional repressor of nem operon
MMAGILQLAMRYQAEHKIAIHQKIVKDAARRVRAEGMTGAAVGAVMQDAGLTHGGFYKHFRNKEELLTEALTEAFGEIGDALTQVARRSKPGAEWKAIVKAYLSVDHCDHAEWGCPVAALGPDLARMDKRSKERTVAEVVRYKNQLAPMMPGRRRADKERAFFVIYSTMVGAVEIARMLPEPAMREKVLKTARDFLLRSF